MSQTHHIPDAWKWLLDLDPDEIAAAVPESVRELIELIGVEATVRLLARFQGQQLYLPKLDGAFRGPRDARIRAEFNGANYAALCRRYGLSTNRIREIVAEEQEYEQRSMFG